MVYSHVRNADYSIVSCNIKSFRSSQWRKIRENDNVFLSVYGTWRAIPTCALCSGFPESFEASVTHTALDLIARVLGVGVWRAAQTGTGRGLVRVPGTGWNIGHGCHIMKLWHGNAKRITGRLWGESTRHWWIFLTQVQCCGTLVFPLLLAWIGCWTNSSVAGKSKRHDTRCNGINRTVSNRMIAS